MACLRSNGQPPQLSSPTPQTNCRVADQRHADIDSTEQTRRGLCRKVRTLSVTLASCCLSSPEARPSPSLESHTARAGAWVRARCGQDRRRRRGIEVQGNGGRWEGHWWWRPSGSCCSPASCSGCSAPSRPLRRRRWRLQKVWDSISLLLYGLLVVTLVRDLRV